MPPSIEAPIIPPPIVEAGAGAAPDIELPDILESNPGMLPEDMDEAPEDIESSPGIEDDPPMPPAPAGGTLTGTGLNGLVLTLHGNGTYPVTYSYVDSTGCSNTITKNLLVESCLGIENLSAESAIFIYPNPAIDIVIAQGDKLTDGSIAPMVCDIMGKSITVPYSRQADKITFNTRSLAAGMYLIKFSINGVVVSKHFVKAE